MQALLRLLKPVRVKSSAHTVYAQPPTASNAKEFVLLTATINLSPTCRDCPQGTVALPRHCVGE